MSISQRLWAAGEDFAVSVGTPLASMSTSAVGAIFDVSVGGTGTDGCVVGRAVRVIASSAK